MTLKKRVSILGVDPGLRSTGWGVLESSSAQHKFCSCGSVSTDSNMVMPLRLLAIFEGIRNVIVNFEVTHLAIEDTYVNVNSQSSLYLAHARAAAILAGSTLGLIAANYQAKTIKKTLTGSGNAEKMQVARMLQLRLAGFEMTKDKDAVDAVAVAFCHAHNLQ